MREAQGQLQAKLTQAEGRAAAAEQRAHVAKEEVQQLRQDQQVGGCPVRCQELIFKFSAMLDNHDRHCHDLLVTFCESSLEGCA